MVRVIVTARGEPKSTEQAVRSILNQGISDLKIIVCDPFVEVKKMIKEKFGDDKRVEFFMDPDEGKSACLNMLLEMYYCNDKNDILVFTDGDVFLNEGSLKSLLKMLDDPEIGIVCGRPVSLNARDNMFGFWSHMFFDEYNEKRKKLFGSGEFLGISGYLFAMRNGVIKQFPVETNEDKVIPSLFWKQGFKVGYCEDGIVNVLNPQNFKDYIIQKKRNVKGRMSLGKQTDVVASESGFFNEAFRGIRIFFTYPKNLKEFWWMACAMFARLYIWWLAFLDVKIKRKKYQDGWRIEETESTKPLD